MLKKRFRLQKRKDRESHSTEVFLNVRLRDLREIFNSEQGALLFGEDKSKSNIKK